MKEDNSSIQKNNTVPIQKTFSKQKVGIFKGKFPFFVIVCMGIALIYKVIFIGDFESGGDTNSNYNKKIYTLTENSFLVGLAEKFLEPQINKQLKEKGFDKISIKKEFTKKRNEILQERFSKTIILNHGDKNSEEEVFCGLPVFIEYRAYDKETAKGKNITNIDYSKAKFIVGKGNFNSRIEQAIIGASKNARYLIELPEFINGTNSIKKKLYEVKIVDSNFKLAKDLKEIIKISANNNIRNRAPKVHCMDNILFSYNIVGAEILPDNSEGILELRNRMEFVVGKHKSVLFNSLAMNALYNKKMTVEIPKENLLRLLGPIAEKSLYIQHYVESKNFIQNNNFLIIYKVKKIYQN